MKRFTHDADLRGMVVLRSLGFQLVPFKLHRFRKQRPSWHVKHGLRHKKFKKLLYQ
ncbi:hypothetical protein [Aeromonas salmonicida]|uniref:hypothetical protein n=1 Tax=Aeromonas salmonicida TaxID=645 RepID=UPI0015E0FA66|nr:hypothetical protein [Aeromonas salmonicida]